MRGLLLTRERRVNDGSTSQTFAQHYNNFVSCVLWLSITKQEGEGVG